MTVPTTTSAATNQQQNTSTTNTSNALEMESEGVYYQHQDDSSGNSSNFESIPIHELYQTRQFIPGWLDSRRAVIVINAINVALVIVSNLVLMYWARVDSNNDENTDDYNDDQQQQQQQERQEKLAKLDFLMVSTPSLVLALLGIYGAYKMDSCCIFLVGAWYVTSTIMELLVLNPFGIIFGGLATFFHCVLADDIQKGDKKLQEQEEQH